MNTRSSSLVLAAATLLCGVVACVADSLLCRSACSLRQPRDWVQQPQAPRDPPAAVQRHLHRRPDGRGEGNPILRLTVDQLDVRSLAPQPINGHSSLCLIVSSPMCVVCVCVRVCLSCVSIVQEYGVQRKTIEARGEVGEDPKRHRHPHYASPALWCARSGLGRLASEGFVAATACFRIALQVGLSAPGARPDLCATLLHQILHAKYAKCAGTCTHLTRTGATKSSCGEW
jgi:hypothetical protein